MRVVFMGTPEFAVPTLRGLVAVGHEVVAAYTQPPRPAGRGKQDRKSAVQLAAEALGIEVLHPGSLKGVDEQAEFAALKADIAVVAAYGLILPQAVLDTPRLGCLNVHASLLPRWRGAAPIQRAILAGDEVTGVTIMRMAAGLDTGPMLATSAVEVGTMTAGELAANLAERGGRLLVEVLSDLRAHPPLAQPEGGVTYAKKIDKAESRLDFVQPAQQAERQVRAFAPSPGAWFELKGERCRVLAADVVEGRGEPGATLDDRLTIACGAGAIRPTLIQRAGRPAMDTSAFLRGRAVATGTRLA